MDYVNAVCASASVCKAALRYEPGDSRPALPADRTGLSGQTELFYDYRTNVASYPAWQRFLRERQPPLLVAWGPRFTSWMRQPAIT
jgi:hypothetical protein